MKYLFVVTLIVLIGCSGGGEKNNNTANTPTSYSGEQLFKTYCSSCHKCDVDFTGPKLGGAISRWKNTTLLYDYVRNPQAVIDKDEYAKSLLVKYKVTMTGFPFLKDREIDAILNYCSNTVPDTSKQ